MEKIVLTVGIREEITNWLIYEFGPPSEDRWGWKSANDNPEDNSVIIKDKHNVYGNVVLFVNKSDAVLFKMRWCNG